ncbi:hypothetical protein NDU88_003909 [Pleurodeles waltl]|uniref:Uncharacterized protein n=1 Tax=Pleurodeles waltl TaxID=8319 RepID=A0AAV7MS36_PLEWA|nr:hypothetical protein NDU88_003909 [Pleurodeles waltl]
MIGSGGADLAPVPGGVEAGGPVCGTESGECCGRGDRGGSCIPRGTQPVPQSRNARWPTREPGTPSLQVLAVTTPHRRKGPRALSSTGLPQSSGTVPGTHLTFSGCRERRPPSWVCCVS